jgi:hypothetical protein
MKPELEAGLFSEHEVDAYWPKIVELMEQVPHTWDHSTVESLQEAIAEGRMQIWGLASETRIEAVLFTQLVTYPAKKVMQVVWACGSGLIEALPEIEVKMECFARMQGCDEVQIIGREGWERIFKPYGFRKSSVTLTRPVAKETH